MIAALVLVPAIGGLVAFTLRADAPRRALLVVTAAVHSLLTVLAWTGTPRPFLKGWLAVDALGLLFLSITSALFLFASVYALGYLRGEGRGRKADFFEDGLVFDNVPEAVFTGCLLLFLATMTLVSLSQHLGILWVAIEATTLSSAPLIYYHRHHRSLEAAWKYLMICSVGIALALLGNFFLAVAASGREAVAMALPELLAAGPGLQASWLRAGFILLLVGYGTKMGLAPLHTWLPDAHGESPSVVSALMSGALLNCAFLGILRAHQVCAAAGEGAFANRLLILFGLLSMLVAGVFILRQADFKRMLAYSSVEHMGILSLGVGIGGSAAFGSMLHAVNHSLTKGMLFLVAGNVLSRYRTKSTGEVTGILRVLPVSGALWIAGFLSITGTPPFAPFLSEFAILKGAVDAGSFAVAAAYLLLLALVFVGMASIMPRMALGDPSPGIAGDGGRESRLLTYPPLLLGAMVLLFGIHTPAWLVEAVGRAAALVGGVAP